jgi:hypothetical protein
MRFWIAAFLALVLAAPGASAYEGGDEEAPTHSATSIAPRVIYYLPDDANNGVFAPGAQLRLHMSDAYSFEASVDDAHYTSGAAQVRTIPIQATIIGYFSPESTLSPYLLIGGGWYPTHSTGGPYEPSRLFSPHVGAGLELLLGNYFSIDASYRFMWMETVDWYHPVQLLGTDFSIRGHMFTLAANFRL